MPLIKEESGQLEKLEREVTRLEGAFYNVQAELNLLKSDVSAQTNFAERKMEELERELARLKRPIASRRDVLAFLVVFILAGLVSRYPAAAEYMLHDIQQLMLQLYELGCLIGWVNSGTLVAAAMCVFRALIIRGPWQL